jgi:hypothetical protein
MAENLAENYSEKRTLTMAKINTNNSTNAALVAMGAIELFEKLTQHPIPQETKVTLLEVFLGVGLWFTGKPSSATHRILKHLGIGNGLDNSGGVGGDVSDRANLRGNPVDTAHRQYGDDGDGLNEGTLERIADGVDYGDRGHTPDPAARAAQYFQQRPSAPVAGSPTIEGAGISAVEFSARSMGGGDDPQSEAW